MNFKGRVERIERLLSPAELALSLLEQARSAGSLGEFLAAIPSTTWPDFGAIAATHVPGFGAEVTRARKQWAESALVEYEAARNTLRLAWTLDLDASTRAAIERTVGVTDDGLTRGGTARSKAIAAAVARVGRHAAVFAVRSAKYGVAAAREWYSATIESDPVYGVAGGGEWVLPESERLRVLLACYGPTLPDTERTGAITFKWGDE